LEVRLEKRRHHHVWQYYTSAWAVDDRVWFLQDRKQIKQSNTVNLGVKNHFYRLKRLSDLDRRLITALIDNSPEDARAVHWRFVAMFDGWYEEKDRLSQVEDDTSEAEAKLDEQIANAEEDYHARIEGDAITTLDRLRAGDAGALDDIDSIAGFSHFLAVQFMRTTGIRSRVLGQFENASKGIDLTGAWAITSHIMAVNFGRTIFDLRKVNPIRLISNATDARFITGDQPVINLQKARDGTQPEYLSLYCPISPQKAIFVDDFRKPLALEDVICSTEIVDHLNGAIVDASNSQIYAETEQCLYPYSLPS
jgi:hypothetical protein